MTLEELSDSHLSILQSGMDSHVTIQPDGKSAWTALGPWRTGSHLCISATGKDPGHAAMSTRPRVGLGMEGCG